jgi:acyl-CoA reductase-like NAD-dependent aldehyde dehydrogenase
MTTGPGMLIDGELVSGPQVFDVVNPSTGATFATAPDCSPAQLDAAMDAAARAFPAWAGDDGARVETLRAIADLIDGAADALASLLTSEQGKPLPQAVAEVGVASRWIRYYAGLDLPVETIEDGGAATVEVRRRAVGPVAALTPWNAPLALAAWKLGPALRAGCTVVLKPSPFTPLSTLLLGEVVREVVPQGVVNVVAGRDPLGARVVDHAVPRKVTFTGSVPTGKLVARSAVSDLKRVTLELGGNDPAIVLDDADVSEIAPRIFAGAFANNGQICNAIKRVYVPERLAADLVAALADQARAAKVGDGFVDGVTLGPLATASQFARLSELVDDALAAGARAAAGGHRIPGPGYFYEPTILYDLSDGVRIVDEEQFGPAVPVVTYRDLHDAVARANDTRFGLGASVWSADPERAAGVADRLHAGTTWVNTHLAVGPHQPFGGIRWSGLGVEGGPWGLHAFTELHVAHRVRPGGDGRG